MLKNIGQGKVITLEQPLNMLLHGGIDQGTLTCLCSQAFENFLFM